MTKPDCFKLLEGVLTILFAVCIFLSFSQIFTGISTAYVFVLSFIFLLVNSFWGFVLWVKEEKPGNFSLWTYKGSYGFVNLLGTIVLVSVAVYIAIVCRM